MATTAKPSTTPASQLGCPAPLARDHSPAPRTASPRSFTNHGDQTLLNKFQGVFESNADIEWFDALVGFLRASGYFAIRPFLGNVPRIRILVGINVDAIMADYHRRGLLFLADPPKALEEFKNDLRKDIQGAAYRRDIESGILQFVEDVVSRKISIRAHPTKRLHAKIYIFRPRGFNEHKPGAVITGSSNLSAAGIGADEQARAPHPVPLGCGCSFGTDEPNIALRKGMNHALVTENNGARR